MIFLIKEFGHKPAKRIVVIPKALNQLVVVPN
jgi:hypothetical protein